MKNKILMGSAFGAVAQLVAHLHGMQGVRGSSPLSSTEYRWNQGMSLVLAVFLCLIAPSWTSNPHAISQALDYDGKVNEALPPCPERPMLTAWGLCSSNRAW